MERMPGVPLHMRDDNLMSDLGAKLREVHDSIRAESGQYGYLGEHRPMEPRSTWQDAFRVMWNALLDDIGNCQGARPEEIEEWRACFE